MTTQGPWKVYRIHAYDSAWDDCDLSHCIARSAEEARDVYDRDTKFYECVDGALDAVEVTTNHPIEGLSEPVHLDEGDYWQGEPCPVKIIALVHDIYELLVVYRKYNDNPGENVLVKSVGQFVAEYTWLGELLD